MGLRVVRDLPEDVWRDYVLSHPDGNIFHTPEIAKVFGLAKGYEPEFWAAVRADRVLALLLPVRVRLIDSFPLRRITTRSIAFGSILAAPGQEGQEAVAHLLTSYTRESRRKSLYTELRNIADLGALQTVFQHHQYAYEGHLNYLVNLSVPREVLFQGIGHRTRKNIRHAINQGRVQVEFITEKQGLAACYDLLCQSYWKARVPLADWSLFEAAFDILSPKGMVLLSLARVDGRPVATSIDLLFKETMFGWYGGVVRSGRSHAANEVLTWEILKWGAENGYRTYDFGGAGYPEEKYGVRDFKAKFGGRLVCYGRNIYVHSRWLLRLSKLGYWALRAFLYGWKMRKIRGPANRERELGT